MSEINLDSLTKRIIEIARKAGDYALLHAGDVKIDHEKAIIGDYATNVDFECERMIVKDLEGIQSDLGNFPIHAEEEHARPDSDIYWVVDPIDGTKNYFRGNPLWSVNIALYDSKNNEVLLGVVYFPDLGKTGKMFSAYKGGGANMNGQSIKPSENDNPEKAMLCVEPPNRTTHFKFDEIYQKLRKNNYRMRNWGIAAELCFVGSGGFDAFIDICGTTQDYDIMAPLIIAKEAGCKVVSFNQKDAPADRLIIVTNGKLKVEVD
jgi:myo-inositol-1(or 4)-monophosphatase